MKEQVFFWHFFKSLEVSLSYERWIDKYQLFLLAIAHGVIRYNDDYRSFRLFCQILFLQDSRDETRFNKLLDAAIVKENERLYQLISSLESLAEKKEEENGAPEKPLPETVRETKEPSLQQEEEKEDEMPLQQEDKRQKGSESEYKHDFTSQSGTMFYKAPAAFGDDVGPQENDITADGEFMHTDEYFSLSRRNMVKGWQFLRNKEKGALSDELDIPATTYKIARDGLFLAPVFKYGARNREDTLIIMADVNGSMTPFHELTSRLIQTARQGGGHSRAPVYYYQNTPIGYVYRKSNLAEPIKLEEALLKSNRNATTIIVISDAGAARGITDETRVKQRQEQTDTFLKKLRGHYARLLWLNPVPEHRWKGTAADNIEGLDMVSVFEQDMFNFQDTLRAIFKKINFKHVTIQFPQR